MGLKATFQNAASTIVSAFGDVGSTFIYHSLGTFTYDPVTGGNIESGDSDVSINAISDEISSDEVQGRDVRMTDRKLLVANNDISVTPKVGDYVTIFGDRFNVIDYRVDPAEALYTLFCRRA